MRPVPPNTDLFGVASHVPGLHVVSAHSRVQADGNEVFVAEHVRRSRGRSAAQRGRRAPDDGVEGEGQLDLFAR